MVDHGLPMDHDQGIASAQQGPHIMHTNGVEAQVAVVHRLQVTVVVVLCVLGCVSTAASCRHMLVHHASMRACRVRIRHYEYEKNISNIMSMKMRG
jgi:hypothetical protein